MTKPSTTPVSRRQLLTAVCGGIAGIAGCSASNPLSSASSCNAAKETFQLLDEGKYEQAAEQYAPHDLDEEATVQEYAEAYQTMTFGAFDRMTVQELSCLCIEDVAPDEIPAEDRTSGLWDKFEISKLQFVQMEMVYSESGNEEQTDRGYVATFKVGGDGWFVIPSMVPEDQMTVPLDECG